MAYLWVSSSNQILRTSGAMVWTTNETGSLIWCFYWELELTGNQKCNMFQRPWARAPDITEVASVACTHMRHEHRTEVNKNSRCLVSILRCRVVSDFLSCRQPLDYSRSITYLGGWLSSVLRLWESLLEIQPVDLASHLIAHVNFGKVNCFLAVCLWPQ